MSKISRRILDKQLERIIFDVFIKTVSDIRTPPEAKNFIEDILSPAERMMIVKRLAIAVLLTKGNTYEYIDHTLKVSRATITNVALWLKHGKGGYKLVIDRILKEQKTEKLINNIEEVLMKFSPPKRYGSIEFERKSKKGKELLRSKLKSERL
jgi:TrpR-related protein YerC/YecD